MSAGRNDPCPCHSQRKYKRCCGPFHEGEAPPTPDASPAFRSAGIRINGQPASFAAAASPDQLAVSGRLDTTAAGPRERRLS